MSHANAGAEEALRKPGARELYTTYLLIALASSGGLLFWTHRLIVEKKRWLSGREFAEYYGLGQIVPGANLFNMALMLGHRYAGVRGMIAAIGGFVSLSFFVMVGVGIFYQYFGSQPMVARALTGMTAVVIGLLFASSSKLALSMPRTWRPWIFILLGFIGVGVMRWPLLWVAVPLAVMSVWLAWRDDGHAPGSSAEGSDKGSDKGDDQGSRGAA